MVNGLVLKFREIPPMLRNKEWQNGKRKMPRQPALQQPPWFGGSVAEVVRTCTRGKDIWEKLCDRFERSNGIRLNTLIETFFKSSRNPRQGISSHVAKLQKLIADLNEELKKQNQNTVGEDAQRNSTLDGNAVIIKSPGTVFT